MSPKKCCRLRAMIFTTFILSITFSLVSAQEKLTGPYLGQTPPGLEAKLFAPGIVSTYANERDIAATPDGKEIYFCRLLGNYSTIVVCKLKDGTWTKPEPASFSGKYDDIEPAISPDGKRFYFVSKRPRQDSQEIPADWDIWFVEREGSSWGEAKNLGAPVNNELNQFFPSVTNDGSIYFNQRDAEGEFIFKAQFKDGLFLPPVKLPKEINAGRFQFNAFIAPDESYIIVPSGPRKGAIGAIDYYISYKQKDGSWSETINMGPKVNSQSRNEYSPFVTRDGKYLFFLSDRSGKKAEDYGKNRSLDLLMELAAQPGNGSYDIYWIDAQIIEELRPR